MKKIRVILMIIIGIVIMMSFNICGAQFELEDDCYIVLEEYGIRCASCDIKNLPLNDYNYIRIYVKFERKNFNVGKTTIQFSTLKNRSILLYESIDGLAPQYFEDCFIFSRDDILNELGYIGSSLYFFASDGYGVIDGGYDCNYVITLHDYEPDSLMDPLIDYRDYRLEVREIQRGRQKMPYWPEHYYYMAQIHAYEYGYSYYDKPVTGWLMLVGGDEEKSWVGNVFQKTYKNLFHLKGPEENYLIKNGDFGILGGKFYMNEKEDLLRFVFIPYENYYKLLHFTIDFKNLNEGVWDRNAFIIDPEDEKYKWPDEWRVDDDDLLENIDASGNVVGEDEIFDPGDESILNFVMDYIDNWLAEVKGKFVDITDIYDALKVSLQKELSEDEWAGVKINLAGIGLASKDVYVVDPGPVNSVRVQLKVIIAGCIYLITGLFVVRKGKDFFS